MSYYQSLKLKLQKLKESEEKDQYSHYEYRSEASIICNKCNKFLLFNCKFKRRSLLRHNLSTAHILITEQEKMAEKLNKI